MKACNAEKRKAQTFNVRDRQFIFTFRRKKGFGVEVEQHKVTIGLKINYKVWRQLSHPGKNTKYRTIVAYEYIILQETRLVATRF